MNLLNESNGDYILIDRLMEFNFRESFGWNAGEEITMEDISLEYFDGNISEISECFCDMYENVVSKVRTKKWHIGRILYFINHPNEIKNIEIDNIFHRWDMLPELIIVDGNHRFAAACWLHDRGKLDKIHCLYGGRLDVLEYLKGNVNELYIDIV